MSLEAQVKSLQTQSLHICLVRRHQGTEVCEYLCLQPGSKGIPLPYPLCALPQRLITALAPIESAVIDDESAQSGGSAADILRTGNDFYVNAKVLCMKGGERYYGRIGNERYAMSMGCLSKCSNVCHLHLGIGDNFEEHGTRVIIYQPFRLIHVCQVCSTHLHPKLRQRLAEERVCVAKEMP